MSSAVLDPIEIIEAGSQLRFDPRTAVDNTAQHIDVSEFFYVVMPPTPSEMKTLRHEPETQGTDPVAGLRTLLEQLNTLRADWADDEAPEPNDLSIRLGERALRIAANHDLLPSRLRPSPDGGVLLAFQRGTRYGKVEIFNDGDAYVAISGFNYIQPKVFPLRADLSSLPGAIELIQTHLGR